MRQTRVVDGRVELWLPIPLLGGWVCGEPDDEGIGDVCGITVESEPCPVHHATGEGGRGQGVTKIEWEHVRVEARTKDGATIVVELDDAVPLTVDLEYARESVEKPTDGLWREFEPGPARARVWVAGHCAVWFRSRAEPRSQGSTEGSQL
jgi:hypothetical protein